MAKRYFVSQTTNQGMFYNSYYKTNLSKNVKTAYKITPIITH